MQSNLETISKFLSCLCEVDGEVVLDGEALVKVPSEKAAKDKRPVMKL